MAGMDHRSFGDANEVRTPDKARVEVVQLGGGHVAARMTLQPGWKWSESIKPIAGTDTCQARHVGAVISGHLRVTCDDGTSADLGPGEAYVIEPGHDASVDGDEPFVAFEFDSSTATSYAAT